MADADVGRDAAVADYFRWNSDGFIQAVSVLGCAAIVLTFAMFDVLAYAGLGYGSHRTHMILLAFAGALGAPVGFRQRHVMLGLRAIAGIVAAVCLAVPIIGWRLVPPAPGATAHLPAMVVVLAAIAFIPAAYVFWATLRQRWRDFLVYCRTPSVWSRPRNGDV